jgi:hypothetical protein
MTNSMARCATMPTGAISLVARTAAPGTFADGMRINRGRIPRLYLSAQTITRDGHRQLKLKERAADLLREESAFEELVLRPT